jgi:hypothetical protein
MWYKKAKNAELRGLRFSISFSQMRNELGGKDTILFCNNKQKSENIFSYNTCAVENQLPGSEKGRISKCDFTFSDLMYNRKNWRDLNKGHYTPRGRNGHHRYSTRGIQCLLRTKGSCPHSKDSTRKRST